MNLRYDITKDSKFLKSFEKFAKQRGLSLDVQKF